MQSSTVLTLQYKYNTLHMYIICYYVRPCEQPKIQNIPIMPDFCKHLRVLDLPGLPASASLDRLHCLWARCRRAAPAGGASNPPQCSGLGVGSRGRHCIMYISIKIMLYTRCPKVNVQPRPGGRYGYSSCRKNIIERCIFCTDVFVIYQNALPRCVEQISFYCFSIS